MESIFKIIVCFAVLLTSCNSLQTKSNITDQNNDGFNKIFNGKNFDGWYLKLRNNDDELAKKVFAIENEEIHVFNNSFPDNYELNTGDNHTHGLFYSKKSYSKYILRFEYKWGAKKVNNFDRWQYDAGVYYHVIKDDVWPVGIEYQIRYNHITNKNHTGDYIRPVGADYKWYLDKENKTYLHPNDGGVPEDFTGKKAWMHRAKPTEDYNGANGKWNLCEIIVMGSEYSIHKLNGEVVNMAFDLKPGAGIFGFQSETAEVYYRNIEIKEFDKIIPAEEFLK